jgi:hypothetical protein
MTSLPTLAYSAEFAGALARSGERWSTGMPSSIADEIEALRCKHGLAEGAPRWIRYFLDAALYHAAFEDAPDADRFVAVTTAVRAASLRIASRWKQGPTHDLCLYLSAEAVRLRDEKLEERRKSGESQYWAWRKLTTLEHWEPVKVIGDQVLSAKP